MTTSSAAAELERISHLCRPDSESFVNPAKSLALELAGTLPMIWGSLAAGGRGRLPVRHPAQRERQIPGGGRHPARGQPQPGGHVRRAVRAAARTGSAECSAWTGPARMDYGPAAARAAAGQPWSIRRWRAAARSPPGWRTSAGIRVTELAAADGGHAGTAGQPGPADRLRDGVPRHRAGHRSGPDRGHPGTEGTHRVGSGRPSPATPAHGSAGTAGGPGRPRREPGHRGHEVRWRSPSPGRRRCWPNPCTPSPTAATRPCSCSGGAGRERAQTEEHPFGFGRERYFYAFVVAVVLFTGGAAFSVYEGIHKITHPEPVRSPVVAFVVLGDRDRPESLSCGPPCGSRTRSGARAAGFAFIRRAKAPELPAVLLEDMAALAGLMFATVGVALAVITGNGVWTGRGRWRSARCWRSSRRSWRWRRKACSSASPPAPRRSVRSSPRSRPATR